jgi:hypothetical protein
MKQLIEHVVIVHETVPFITLKWLVDLRDRFEVSQQLILDELFNIGRLATGDHRPNHVDVLVIL